MTDEKQRELIFTALGEASMCWIPIPAGEFDSSQCQAVGEKLIADLGLIEGIKK